MPSRMEKYYKTDLPKQRSNINKNLYESIYEKGIYTNIEGIATIDKPNEIDLNKIRELITSKDDNHPKRSIEPSKKMEHKISVDKVYDSSAYDIRDILDKAKSERTLPESNHRNLKNTQYDILKDLKVDSHDEKEELKELFNTIANNRALNKLDTKELSLDMLDNLKSNGTNVNDSLSIKKVIESKKDYVNSNDENELDKSFFTSSLGFKKDDFEEMKDINVNLKRSNILMKIVLFILLVGVVTGIIFGIYEFIIK
ncbi:MAG: hypothetical protein RSB72_02125 [Bacilli bacterium]